MCQVVKTRTKINAADRQKHPFLVGESVLGDGRSEASPPEFVWDILLLLLLLQPISTSSFRVIRFNEPSSKAWNRKSLSILSLPRVPAKTVSDNIHPPTKASLLVCSNSFPQPFLSKIRSLGGGKALLPRTSKLRGEEKEGEKGAPPTPLSHKSVEITYCLPVGGGGGEPT